MKKKNNPYINRCYRNKNKGSDKYSVAREMQENLRNLR